MHKLKVFKKYRGVPDLSYGTSRSGCFDFSAYLGPEVLTVKTYTHDGTTYEKPVKNDRLVVYPLETVIVPTGYCFDFADGQRMNVYPRSSTSIKKGLTLVNNVGIIDEDYVDEVFMALRLDREWNDCANTKTYTIDHGERLCQGEVIQYVQSTFEYLPEQPAKKGDRTGGVGSTG